MGYRIHYNRGNSGVSYSRVGNGKKNTIWLCLIPVVVLCWLFREQIINLILPGDPEITKNAVSVFVEELREGERITSAFSSFCRVVLNEEKIS